MIKDYFLFYDSHKTVPHCLKKFNFLNRRSQVVEYLKKNKKDIIKNINYAFFESDEPFLISVFSKDSTNYIHINSRLCKNFPKIFDHIYEYENYLAIFGTFAILFDVSFQIEDLDDSRNSYKDLLNDMTFHIYYDDHFRLNLENFLINKNEILRFVYRYGYDFLLESFKSFMKNKNIYNQICSLLHIEENEFEELYLLFENKFRLEGSIDE